MVLRLFVGCALALGGCAPALGVTTLAHASSQADGRQADRGRLAVELTRALHAHPHFGIFDDVAAEIEDGTAVLTGRVTSEEKKARLGACAADVPGVRGVRNLIDVLRASAADDDLRYRIARALYGDPAFWSHAARANPPIHIIVEEGHVTLTGVVDTPAERALAKSLAGGFGERSLTNRLRLRSR